MSTEVDEKTQESYQTDATYDDKETVALYKQVPMETVCVYDVDFGGKESAIVIGGETHGVSAAAHKLAFDRHGGQMFLPMMPGLESMNSAMAATAILFEVRRQILLRQLFNSESDSESDKLDTETHTT